MTPFLPFIEIALLVLLTVLVGILLGRKPDSQGATALANLERTIRDEFARNREESSGQARHLREELAQAHQKMGDTLQARASEIAQIQQAQLESFRQGVDSRFSAFTNDTAEQTARTREQAAASMKELSEALQDRMTAMAKFQHQQMEVFNTNLHQLSRTTEEKLENVREAVETKLRELRQDNNLKLDQMRATVDEKLHATLEQRLGESFKLVSERLEQVHTGLGEMRGLAAGVGDLKKVLTNIKTRGCWGEVQLGTLLDQMLTREQFATNVAIGPDTNERVEFAVKLPGREMDGQPVWLPIDAKFPQEEYQRLVEATERGDADAAEQASAALETSIKNEAKKIQSKYVKPPYSTDFALMFLPTEGLFAEVLRRPGLCDNLQRDWRVVVCGPTTLAAVLSSLQMGFRTLAIEKRSSEVWNVLGAVKTEFGKFGAALEKVQKKLNEASNSIEDAAKRSRAVERKLRDAEELPATEAAGLLGLEAQEPEALE